MDLLGMNEIRLGPGWAAFSDPQSYLQYASTLVLATISGLVLAHHPAFRVRPMNLDDLEQQKTLVIYAVVGAMIAIICATAPTMAFVIFGIGGLMRFRTDLGASKHTGHTIMGTLVGLCWGLGLELVAAFATLYFWLMIFLLERQRAMQLIVGGVSVASMVESSDAYRSAIQRAGGLLTAHSKNFKVGQMTFVFRLSQDAALDRIVREVQEIPVALRGTPHWPE